MDTLVKPIDLVKSGWRHTKEHFWFLFLTLVVVFVVTSAASNFPPFALIVGVFTSISIITLSLEITAGVKPIISDLWKKYHHWRLFVNYLLASFLMAVIVGIGLLLLVIPGIYLAIRLQFYKFLIVDKEDIGPWMAIKESWRMTDGHSWKLFLFMLLIILINLVGAVLLGIGLLVSIPVSLIAYAVLYRQLLANVSLVPAA